MPLICRKPNGQKSHIFAATYGHSLRRPVPHRGSRDTAGTDRTSQGRCVRCNTECRPDAGDFRDRRGRLAHNRCLGDAGPVAPQRPYFVVCGTGRALTMTVHPIGTSSRRKAAAAAGLDCAAAFQKIALDCVASIKAHHTNACAGDAEAVHQIRVAITRLRAAVAFFAPIVVDAEWLRLKKEIAWLNGSLGAARDSDVVVGLCAPEAIPRMGARRDRRAARKRQTRDHRRLARCLRSVRTQRLLAAMAGWIRQGTVAEALQAEARMRKPCKPTARASSTAGTNG